VRPGDERGFALVAALGALAAFAFIAFTVLAADRGNLAMIGAMKERARLSAAADAGLALGIAGVAGGRWPIDGSRRRIAFDGMTLVIGIEDERGKIRLNDLDEAEARRMFEAAGAQGGDLDMLVDAFLDWRDPDDDARAEGAEAADYPPGSPPPRNGALRSVSELGSIRGMTPALLGRIAPAATVYFGESGGFSPATASPFARAVMGGKAAATDPSRAPDLRARPLTVRVTVDHGREGHLERATVVEFPHGPGRDWKIRFREDG
jgi:general secretion pathway protein K